MKEHHYAYKIVAGSADLVCSQSEFEEDKMLDLLKEIKQSHHEGLFWVFKQLDDENLEPLCIIDCLKQRIYYHYSGEVDNLDNMIKKLSHAN